MDRISAWRGLMDKIYRHVALKVNVWNWPLYKAPFLEHEGVADQGHPGSVTSHRGPDAEWVNYFR